MSYPSSFENRGIDEWLECYGGGESSRPREASDVEESQGVRTPNQPGGDEGPPPEAASTREVSEDDEFQRMLELGLRRTGFQGPHLSEDQLARARRVENHSPEVLDMPFQETNAVLYLPEELRPCKSRKQEKARAGVNLTEWDDDHPTKVVSDGEVLANDEIQPQEASEVQEQDEWDNPQKMAPRVGRGVMDEDSPFKAQVESEDVNLQSREVSEDQGEIDPPVKEDEWAAPGRKKGKKGKKGRSAIVFDVELPLEEARAREVLGDDDLQPQEPQVQTDLEPAVVIEETVQVDRKSRGKEKKSTRFFTNLWDSPSPKARSTEEKRQHSGRESRGYREYSSFLASDADFLVFRKFGAANVRVLLSLQHQVYQYELALDRLDNDLSQNNDVNNGQLEGDDPERQRIVEALHESLSKYSLLPFVPLFPCPANPQPPDAFLIQVAEITKWPTADPVNVRSLKNWHRICRGVISVQDQTYINKIADLCNLVPPDVNPLRRFLDRWNFFMLSPLWWKPTDPDLPVYESPQVIYISDKKMDRFVLFLTVLIWLAMLIAPLWILYFVADAISKLGIITGFIVLFLGVVAVLTDSSPSDMLAATAG